MWYFLALGLLHLCSGTTVTLRNNCGYTVWAGMYARTKSNPRYVPPSGGGWHMSPGQVVNIPVPNDLIAGRWWGRTGCRTTNGHFHCDTGDCGPWLDCGNHHSTGEPPASLAEITLNSPQDFYDLSLVDGFNIPLTLKPTSRYGGGNAYWCKEAYCRTDMNAICPSELQKVVNGRVVGCKSACVAFHRDEYCCAGAHNRPQTCNPATWPKDYHAVFKNPCPTAYSYAYDDHTSTFTCQNTNYDVIFC
ncbi:uncharacterized protein [Mytilus edulis]|uniref:Uncharacterized protein n=2 Tax=Mytilus galloprovincialis TaxID=29158 RepID=A0A8B6GLR6_MYTGA|nr:Hypothetical predicted protein [Mytilus galloprovincialis]VDI65451.1 Hypothetical predicted protein [Mytilus galloprovincialis]